jgi:hypothetical protein
MSSAEVGHSSEPEPVRQRIFIPGKPKDKGPGKPKDKGARPRILRQKLVNLELTVEPEDYIFYPEMSYSGESPTDPPDNPTRVRVRLETIIEALNARNEDDDKAVVEYLRKIYPTSDWSNGWYMYFLCEEGELIK